MLDLARILNKDLDETLLEHLETVPSMLLKEERGFLYNYAHEIYRGQGCIIDGGPLFGGSTVSLCKGLTDRNWQHIKCIDVFDLFKTEDYMIEDYKISATGIEIPKPSFKPLFDNYLKDYQHYIHVYAGDAMQSNWQAKPVELLFIDLAKSNDLNQYMVKTFFPHLIPGVSLLIQQDFIHDWTPWLPITMGYFKDYFSYVTHSYINSVVYKLEKPIPQKMIDDFDFMSYSFEDALKIYNKTVAPFEETPLQKQMFAEGRKHLYMQIVHGEYYRGQPNIGPSSFTEKVVRKLLKVIGR